ncbi:MAG: penicillin-binding protein 2 [Sedimentisphaerales bacterium]|nr:penicillin-binding protein 2 [Sedimentisphaerales bacterium]
MDRCLTQQQSRNPLTPRRGTILDNRGRVLAASNGINIIKAEPRIIENPDIVATTLAPIVEMDPHEIRTLIVESRNPGYAKIKVQADANQCTLARKIKGIGVESQWIRHYPLGRLTAHVVGFTSRDNRGLEGLELYYDNQLTGSAAQSIFLADIARRPICLNQAQGVLCDGAGIILTLDATIQQFVRSALIEQFEKYQAASAVAVVAEPKTGAILAMVSLPDFIPLEVGTTDPNNFRSRAITDWYEPGSIIKPIVMAIALDAGVLGRNEKIFCENGSYSGKGFGRIGEYRNGFGYLTPREILIKSSNIGMAKIGQKLGKKKLHDGLKRFGFGAKTGIELPGEVTGLLWPAGKWTGYSETRVPFGQEICVTAMQMVRAFCILANGGRLIQPYLVKAIVNSDGTIEDLKRPPPVGYIVKPEIARWVISDAMAAVVNEGTGKRAKLDKWQVFGKTGTANIAREDGPGYSQDDYIASFVSGAPAEDPQIVVLVSIRKPNKKLGLGYTGGVVASPVAAEIIEKTLTYLEKLRQPAYAARSGRRRSY